MFEYNKVRKVWLQDLKIWSSEILRSAVFFFVTLNFLQIVFQRCVFFNWYSLFCRIFHQELFPASGSYHSWHSCDSLRNTISEAFTIRLPLTISGTISGEVTKKSHVLTGPDMAQTTAFWKDGSCHSSILPGSLMPSVFFHSHCLRSTPPVSHFHLISPTLFTCQSSCSSCI